MKFLTFKFFLILLYLLSSSVSYAIQEPNLKNLFIHKSQKKLENINFKNIREESGFTIKYREDPIVLDPRNKELGGRLIINLEKLYLSIKKLELSPAASKDYYDFSFRLGVSQINTDKLQNKLFGIECNFEELNGIDFKKGCYVGPVSYTHLTLPTKA